MDIESFWMEAEARIKKYDLLTHPFYVAWAKGELAKEDLKMYAMHYYKHVEAFPEYLEALEKRLPENGLRTAIRENREDELGSKSADKKSHSDMWLDFAQGMGADSEASRDFDPMPEVKQLISQFRKVAERGSSVEALAAFYAYESQVPRIAGEKAMWLKDLYGADTKSCRYFSVHSTADIEHANIWKQLISKEIAGAGVSAAIQNGNSGEIAGERLAEPVWTRRTQTDSQLPSEKMQLALDSVESTAKALWKVLDGIDEQRIAGTLTASCCH